MKRPLSSCSYCLASAIVISSLSAALLVGCATSDQGGFGTISTIAGTGKYGYSGDGGLAIAAELNQPTCAVKDSAGNLYIGDVATFTVRRVDARTGIISTYAGTGKAGYSGDGGLATSALLYGPSACTLSSGGDLFLADVGNNVIRKVDAATGLISTVAGNGKAAGSGNGDFSGDGGLAINASLNHPMGVAIDKAGDLYVSDAGNQRVRMIDAKTGIITTIAGSGQAGYSSQDSKAIDAMLSNPAELALDALGDLYIAEMGSSVVSKLTFNTGELTIVAGNGTSGDGYKVLGDGGRATQAQLAQPMGIAITSSGDLLIADTGNQLVREVSSSSGVITTVVGNRNIESRAGYSGDGHLSNEARLHNPEGLFLDSSGDLLIADSYNSVVRVIEPTATSLK